MPTKVQLREALAATGSTLTQVHGLGVVVTAKPLGHVGDIGRWNSGKALSFVPLRPERVVEVRYDHLEGRQFRHMAQVVRWRRDRDPRSCGYDQLEETVGFDLDEVLVATAT